MVAKLSIYLMFVLMVLPYYLVLCQDDEWLSLLDQAQDYGISQETVAQAQSVIGNSTMEQVAEDALSDGSLADWVLEATEDESTTPPAEAPTGLPSDVDNSPNLAPIFPPNAGPELAPNNAPLSSPLSAPLNAPLSAPSPSPYAASPKA